MDESLRGTMKDVVSVFTMVVMCGIGFAVVMMGIVTMAALIHRAAKGGVEEYAVFNLGALVCCKEVCANVYPDNKMK